MPMLFNMAELEIKRGKKVAMEIGGARKALGMLVAHPATHTIPIEWKRDKSLLVERALYLRWVDLWDTL